MHLDHRLRITSVAVTVALVLAAATALGVLHLPSLVLTLGGALTIANNARNLVELGRV